MNTVAKHYQDEEIFLDGNVSSLKTSDLETLVNWYYENRYVSNVQFCNNESYEWVWITYDDEVFKEMPYDEKRELEPKEVEPDE